MILMKEIFKVLEELWGLWMLSHNLLTKKIGLNGSTI